MRLFVISALVIAFLAILFALQNTNLVTIQFFIWKYEQSLALILLGTLALGVIVGLLVSFPAIVRRNYKVARTQKQIDTLSELVQEKEQAVNVASRKIEAVKHNYGELLKALGLIEPVTGLLRQDLLPQAIATQIASLSTPSESASVTSFSLLLFKVQPEVADGYSPEVPLLPVARLLQKHATVNTWFYSDGQGLFAATTPNLDVKAATRYGEDLQEKLLEQFPAAASGQAIKADVSVGGAIATPDATIDASQLIAIAESALDQALQRGRKRLKVLPAG